MAGKKASKKNKSSKGKGGLIFPLLALAVVSILFYYLIFNVSTSNNDVELKPIKKHEKTAKKQKETVPDTIYAEKAEEPQESIASKPPVKEEEDEEDKNTVPKPVITEKGKYYSIDPKLPKICIIVDDFGYIDGKRLDDFLSLDKQVAFSILPGLKHSVSTMKKAVQNGNEVLIHAPMEPESYPKDNPGDNAILVGLDDKAIKERINSYAKELYLAIGINHHMGSKAAADNRVVNAVMATVKDKGLFYIDSYTNDKSVVAKYAANFKVPFAKRNQFLDVPESSKNRAILKVDEIKKMKSSVIVVITHCHNDVKFRQLKFFIERLKDNHYQLVPPSKAVKINRAV